MPAFSLWRPEIAIALEFAKDNNLVVHLSCSERPRESGPLICSILETATDTTTFATTDKSLLEIKGDVDFRIFFKLDDESYRKLVRDEKFETGDKLPISLRHGFFCRARSQKIEWNEARGLTTIVVKRPSRSMSRELRRHERLRIKDGMLNEFHFWLAPALPVHREQFQTFMNKQNDKESIRLIDISAGGAFVKILNPDFLQGIELNAATYNLLFIDLLTEAKGPKKFFLVGRLTHVDRNKSDNTLNLHMRFIQYLGAIQQDTLKWETIGDQGIAAIGQWVAKSLGREDAAQQA